MAQTGTIEADEEALRLLGEVRLQSFTASPTTIGPFDSSRLSWKVTAPDRVKIRLDNVTVAANGEQLLHPDASETYRLSAKAGRLSRSLGVVTVHVNLVQCTTLDTALLPQFLAPEIQKRIDADDSGLYFRRVPTLGPNNTIISMRSKPSVTISDGRLNILLQLGKDEDNFPDPSIDLSVSFGLGVVPGPVSSIGRRIVATDAAISIDITFPFYAWLIPGAMIALPIAIDNGKQKARTRALQITEIVGPGGPGHATDKSLNTFFVPSPGLQKHDVRLYVDSDGDGIFAVTYCPDAGPPVIG